MPYRHNQFQDDLEFDANPKPVMSPAKTTIIMTVISAAIYFLI